MTDFVVGAKKRIPPLFCRMTNKRTRAKQIPFGNDKQEPLRGMVGSLK
jgi:hypothetical protein